MKILGNVDRCDETLIEGWVTIDDNPDEKVAVDIMLEGNPIGHCIADLFRQDLQDAKLGGGRCAFLFNPPTFLARSQFARISVRLKDSSVFLKNASGALPQSGEAKTSSKFGGLWVDDRDWLDQLAHKHRKKEISDELSIAIFRFVRDGYIVIKEAVPLDLVDHVNLAIETAWHSPPEGLKIETFEPDGQMKVISPDIIWREGRTKMLDLFAYSPVVRQSISSPKVIEFLSALFDDKPKAFQSLTFWNGSQQAIHKDTAYVKIDSNPMHLAASWLALEDIAPGTGELEYYIGSHKAPDFLFGGSSKWMESYVEEHESFLSSLHSDAKTYGHVKGSFLANKGDVLIWHADLAHGGSQITHPGRSRRSLVTHFTSAGDEPFYRRKCKRMPLDEPACSFVSQYTDVKNAF